MPGYVTVRKAAVGLGFVEHPVSWQIQTHKEALSGQREQIRRAPACTRGGVAGKGPGGHM